MPYTDQIDVLFFGNGRFIRGFCCELYSRAAETQTLGRVVTMQRSYKPGETEVVRDFQVVKQQVDRLDIFAKGGMRKVRILGVQNGTEIDEIRTIDCIEEMLAADRDWEQLIKLSRSESLKWMVSNGGEWALKEIGKELPPMQTHFGKLVLLLLARFNYGGNPLQILATELTPKNGNKVKKEVLRIAETFERDGFVEWLKECRFRSSLVDRIIPGIDGDHPEYENDPGLILAEPYGYWSIETKEGDPKFIEHPFVAHKPDISLDVRRKLFFLNCAHTALVQYWLTKGRKPAGLTVRQAVTTHGWKPWVLGLHDEVLTTFSDEHKGVMSVYMAEVMERFGGPISQVHILSGIFKNHPTKIKERVQPVVDALPADLPDSILRQVLEWSQAS